MRSTSLATEGAKELVHTGVYQRLLSQESLGELSRYYLCAASIFAAQTELIQAGWAALKAAWAGDDLEEMGSQLGGEPYDSGHESEEIRRGVETVDPDGPRYCRKISIGYWRDARNRGQAIADDPSTEQALLADVYRRMGDLEEARAAAHAGIDAGAEGVVFNILNFQLGVIQAGDTDCHNLGEIGEEGEWTIYL